MSLEAEQAVLGAMLTDNRSVYRFGALEPGDFDSPLHARLFAAMREAIDQNKPVDALTVDSLVEGEQDWEYLVNLSHSFPSIENAPAYAGMVRSASKHRRSKKILSAALAKLESDPKADITEDVLRRIGSLATNDRPDVTLGAAIEVAKADRAEAEEARRNGRISGVSTTIPSVDAITGGFKNSRLYVLGGRPGSYKSALAWQICIKAARLGTPCGYLSLEMPPEELGERALLGGTDANLPVRIDSTSRRLNDLCARMMEWRTRHGIAFVVVDHLQLVIAKGSERRHELAGITRKLKELAMDLSIPVLALSQLQRNVEKENRMPIMSDLAESGSIEQDADGVMFLARLEQPGGPDASEWFFAIEKMRGGRARTRPIPLRVDGARMRVGESV